MLSRIAAVILGKILQNLFSTFFILFVVTFRRTQLYSNWRTGANSDQPSPLYSPTLGAGQAPISVLFLYFSGIASLFPFSHQLLKYIISKVLTHPTVSRTEEISLKTVVHRREIAVEREMAKTSCFRPPWNGLSASPMLSSQWIGNLYGVTFPKSKNDKSWCVQGSSFLCHQSVILFFFCVGTKNR